MKMFKIVSLLMVMVFSMSSMSLTFAAPMTNNNLQLTSNSHVTPDSLPDYVELTVKKGELFTLPYCDNREFCYSYKYNTNFFNRYYSDDNADLFRGIKEGTRTIMVNVEYCDEDCNCYNKMIEYRVTVTP
jgi:hypothetical protein